MPLEILCKSFSDFYGKVQYKATETFHYRFCKNYIGFYWKVFVFVGNLPCLCEESLFFGILIFFITDYEKVIKNILYAICKMLLVELY